MGKALAEAFPICRETFDEADAALGEPLSRLCFEGPRIELTLTENTQPAILAVSIAACRLLASRGLAPAFVAGHSLGEYSANVAAGTFAFADALPIVRRRGRYMQEAVPVGTGAMAAILGLDAERSRRPAREAGGKGEVVSPANLNGAGQVVIAGTRDAVARAGERAKALGAKRVDPAAGQRAVSLRADEAGRGAARARAARAGDVHDPRVPIVANVDAEPKRDARGRDRGARRAGVGAGAVGSGRAAPCVGGRHNVC